MSEEQLYELSQLEAVAAGSQEFVNKMVDMFLSLSPELVNRMKSSLNAKDWDDLRSAAHKLKPSIDMMGIASLTGKIREIEGNAKTQTQLDSLPNLLKELEETLENVYDQLRRR
jgi:HPt (histidine-containing phosphotransfer) domain-containing protein